MDFKCNQEVKVHKNIYANDIQSFVVIFTATKWVYTAQSEIEKLTIDCTASQKIVYEYGFENL